MGREKSMTSSQEITRARGIWETLRRSIFEPKERESGEAVEDFVTPPQSPEHLAEKTLNLAIKRDSREIQRNKEQVLARKANKLFLPDNGGERDLLSWFEQALLDSTSRNPDPQQCLAVYKQVTSDFMGLAEVPTRGLGRTLVLLSTYIPASDSSPGVTIHHISGKKLDFADGPNSIVQAKREQGVIAHRGSSSNAALAQSSLA
jgi:hypothetical protein